MGNAADDRLNERSRPVQEAEFGLPRYLMVSVADGAEQFMTLCSAQIAFEKESHEVAWKTLLPDFSVREMSGEETFAIFFAKIT